MDRNSKDQGQQTPKKHNVLHFDKDQPSEQAGPPNPTRYHPDELVPRFDEGGRKPAAIESTTNDGVRSTPPNSRATSGEGPDDEKNHTEATMPPGEGRNPKRSTM